MIEQPSDPAYLAAIERISDSSIPPPARASLHILIIDDDDSVSRALARLLQQAGHTTSIASNGSDGVRILMSEERFGCILLDMNLGPGLDGQQVAAIRYQDPRLHEIPLIVISAMDPELIRARARVNVLEGVSWVLDKPIDADVLLRILDDLPKAPAT